HLVALGEHVVKGHVADDAAKGRGGDVLGRAREVLDLDHRVDGVDDAVEDDEVDRDRRVVLRDRGLPRDLEVLLAQVDEDRPIDDRDQEDDPRAFRADAAAEAEDDVALVLADDTDAQVEEDEDCRYCDDRADDCAEHVGETLYPRLAPSAWGRIPPCAASSSWPSGSPALPSPPPRMPVTGRVSDSTRPVRAHLRERPASPAPTWPSSSASR